MHYTEGSLGPPLAAEDLSQEMAVTLVNTARGTVDECWVLKSNVYSQRGVDVIDVASTTLPSSDVFTVYLYNMGLAQDRYGKTAEHLQVFTHPSPCNYCQRSI